MIENILQIRQSCVITQNKSIQIIFTALFLSKCEESSQGEHWDAVIELPAAAYSDLYER